MAVAEVVRLRRETSIENFDPGSEDRPRNVRAERSVIGTLLCRNMVLDRVIDLLHPEHFSDRLLGNIYGEIRQRLINGIPVEVTTICDWVSMDHSLAGDQRAATRYLSEILNCAASVDIRGYGETIANCAVRRAVIEASEKAIAAARNPRVDMQQEVTKLTAGIDTAAQRGDRFRTSSFDEALDAAIKHAHDAHERGNAGGLPIPGFPRVSKAFTLLPQELSIIAGVTGAGKSGVAWQMVINIARWIRDEKIPLREIGSILGFSLEMRRESLGIRALSTVSGIPANDILHGNISKGQLDRLEGAKEELKNLPLSIVDINGLTKQDIKLKMYREQLRFGKIALVVVDHLNLVSHGQYGERHGKASGTADVADATLELAKQFNCHVLGLCQLNQKDMAARNDHRPTVADIRYSGNFAANADNIGLLHRQIMWEPTAPPAMEPGEYHDDYRRRKSDWENRQSDLSTEAEMLIGKSRMSAAGYSIPLIFDAPTTSFSERPGSSI